MINIPLFPLNTVLFPGMPLTLHIFEERYKLMIAECLRQETPFGVVLIDEGQEALGPLAKPHTVGCTARITRMEPLDGGRMNINSIGEKRFVIQELSNEGTFLTAAIEFQSIRTTDPDNADRMVAQFMPFLARYLDILAQIGQIEFDPSKIPTDPKELAYISAYLVQTSPTTKQDLLASNTTEELFDRLREVFRKETALIRAMSSHTGNDSSQVFSKN